MPLPPKPDISLSQELRSLGWSWGWARSESQTFIFGKLDRAGVLIAVEGDKTWQEDIKKLSQANFNRVLARTLLHA